MITFIQSRWQLYKKHISKYFSKFLPPPKSNHHKPPVNLSISDLIIYFFRLFVAKYIKKDLQKILKIILKVGVLPFDRPCKKFLKIRWPDVYCNKSYMKYSNLCQKCKNQFATARAKISNRILFIAFFLHVCINFR